MSGSPSEVGDQGAALLGLYDSALPDVYGYLLSRCGSAAVAEDLTSETFMAAVDAVKRGAVPTLTVAWLIGVARHKLVDHFRRRERDERALHAVAGELQDDAVDDWDVRLDAVVARATLATLRAQHRCALTLRYLDGLPVAQVAELVGRTEGAVEVLLVRAKAAFRVAYEQQSTSTRKDER